MDLASFASQLNQTNTTAAKQLLPQQQQNRSYTDAQNYSELVINLTRFKMGETKDGWTIQYKVNFPIGTLGSKASSQQIMAYAKDYLASNTDKEDLKYIDIIKADTYMIEYRFNHEAWFRANFSQTPHYNPPITLYWHYKILFPRIIYVNQYGSDLKHFIEEKFEKWIDTKKSYLKNPKFKFIENVAAKLFTFKWDYTGQRMYAHLKYSVILGSLALYLTLFHDKDASKMDIKKIQQQAANFGDVKRLDKYIKKLK